MLTTHLTLLLNLLPETRVLEYILLSPTCLSTLVSPVSYFFGSGDIKNGNGSVMWLKGCSGGDTFSLCLMRYTCLPESCEVCGFRHFFKCVTLWFLL